MGKMVTLKLDCGCFVALRYTPHGRRFVKLRRCNKLSCSPESR